VAPCGGAQSMRENTGQAVQVSPSCKSNSVDLGSVPTDFATAVDYDVSENNAGGTPAVGRGEGSPDGNAGHQGTSGGNNDGGGGLGGGGGNGGSGSGDGGGNSGGSGSGTGNGGANNGNGNGGGGTGNGGNKGGAGKQ